MASIQRRTLKDGSFSYRVAWREQGRQRTRTFSSQREAKTFAANPTGARQVEVTGMRVDDVNVTDAGGSAVVHITWNWAD